MRNCAFMGDSYWLSRVYPQELRQEMQAAGMNTDNIITQQTLREDPQATKDVEYIFSTWGMLELSEAEIKGYFPSLKAVFYAAGSVKGFAPAFLNCGVSVFSAWAANGVPVAECTVAEIILANKGFWGGCRTYKQTKSQEKGREKSFESCPGNYNTNVGIIGAGMIGKLVIERLKAFQLNILVFDPFLSEEAAQRLGVQKCSLEVLFESCHTISNHLADKPETVGMLNYDLFSRMKPNGVFINTGRGAQVVEEDLIRALTDEPDRFAVLDVTCQEPPQADSPLYSMENVVLSPHIAGSFGNEFARMAQYMLGEYRLFKNREKTNYAITKEMLKTMA